MTRSPHQQGSFIIAAAAAAALAVVAAGCGGGSSSGLGSASPSITTTTSTAQNGALAFARCMRSHGIPGWPDPTSDGGFDKSKLRQLRITVPQVRSLEEGPCNHLLNGGPSSGYTITPADRIDYLKGAACMRRHGFPSFPDPTFGNNTVTFTTPPGINPNSARARSAVAICARLIPPGLPYSHSDAGRG